MTVDFFQEVNKMRKVLIGVVCFTVGFLAVVTAVVWVKFPACLAIRDNEHSVVETIVNHRIPRAMRIYAHSGKPELVVTKSLTDPNAMNAINIVWVKVVDKGMEMNKGVWEKLKDKLSSLVRFLAFDENGALVLTDYSYRETNELARGDYMYLQTLRVEVDAKMLGTYIWEFPVYVDENLTLRQRNDLCREMREGSDVRYLQEAMSELDKGNGSKVSNTEKGAVYTGNQIKLTVEFK